MTLAERIRLYREQRGWTQKELSERAQLPQSRVSELESGKQWTTAANILKLAQAFGITMEQLMKGEQDEEGCPAGVDVRRCSATPGIRNFQARQEVRGV